LEILVLHALLQHAQQLSSPGTTWLTSHSTLWSSVLLLLLLLVLLLLTRRRVPSLLRLAAVSGRRAGWSAVWRLGRAVGGLWGATRNLWRRTILLLLRRLTVLLLTLRSAVLLLSLRRLAVLLLSLRRLAVLLLLRRSAVLLLLRRCAGRSTGGRSTVCGCGTTGVGGGEFTS